MRTGILVLNSDYTPINITTFKRGFNLVFKNKAEVVKSEGNPIDTFYGVYHRPVIIRLLNYVTYKTRRISITRGRILKRDGHRCVYCGHNRNLTIDHVIPKSRGGKNSWTNMVTCCSKCNSKKGDRTPEEANMKSVYPKEPTMFSDIMGRELLTAWEEFKSGF
jgi:hypothetical protein